MTLITNSTPREPTWEVIGGQSLTDEALDALACLLLEDLNSADPRIEVDRHQDNGQDVLSLHESK